MTFERPYIADRTILECVPNLSEGRRRSVIDLVVGAADRPSVHLLDVHSDGDHNRTVLTLAGSLTGLVEAVLAATEVAAETVDLSRHQGVHPRLGAMDVIPFVPILGSPMREAIMAARVCAERIWRQLGIPCFLNGNAAGAPDRRALPDIRRRAFRELSPDLGGPYPHPTAGATVVGAREVLVAYNIVLETERLSVAARIASAIRERDRGLPHVRALGFPLASRAATQVSTSLLRPTVTTIADVFDAVTAAAAAEGVEVLEAELIGLAPRAALAGRDPESLGLSLAPKILEEELGRVFDQPPGSF
ncbi:MAG: glutamate formimidoyltransferase [Actinomycetota bacterium]